MSTQAIAASPTNTDVPDTPLTTEGSREPILVVEADADLGRVLVEQLAADGHPTELARTAGHARWMAGARLPRLLVLGELDGPRGTIDLLESIRADPPERDNGQTPSPWPDRLPVIVLSARTTQADLLRAFEAGADDFLGRSAGYLELRARLRALLRRAESRPEDKPLRIGALTIDPANHAVSLHGKRLELRRLEYELLLYLARKPNRVFHKHELLKAIWGYHSSCTTRTLDSHASRLRCKLRVAGEHWIINEWGVGYRLV
ncbi:MAG: response regulator transcription factor [Solirubrobacteraceae bacterium]|jgi:DNA-binding response OmpR family regulator